MNNANAMAHLPGRPTVATAKSARHAWLVAASGGPRRDRDFRAAGERGASPSGQIEGRTAVRGARCMDTRRPLRIGRGTSARCDAARGRDRNRRGRSPRLRAALDRRHQVLGQQQLRQARRRQHDRVELRGRRAGGRERRRRRRRPKLRLRRRRHRWRQVLGVGAPVESRLGQFRRGPRDVRRVGPRRHDGAQGRGRCGPCVRDRRHRNGNRCDPLLGQQRIRAAGQRCNLELGVSTVQVVGISDATAIAASGSHTCAIVAGGVKCWGNNWFGQLGDSGTLGSSAVPVDVTLGQTALTIAAGENHTCALLASGGVACWGWNYYGQAGALPYYLSNGTEVVGPTAVPVVGATAVGAGGSDSVPSSAVAPAAPSRAGAGRTERLGGAGADDSRRLNGAISLAVGGVIDPHDWSPNTHCALVGDGVQCWGGNDVGQLGNGYTENAASPVDVVDITDAGEIAAGAAHTCAAEPGVSSPPGAGAPTTTGNWATPPGYRPASRCASTTSARRRSPQARCTLARSRAAAAFVAGAATYGASSATRRATTSRASSTRRSPSRSRISPMQSTSSSGAVTPAR